MANKDVLAIRTLLLRQGRSAAMFAREDKQLRDFLNITELILDERRLHVSVSSSAAYILQHFQPDAQT